MHSRASIVHVEIGQWYNITTYNTTKCQKIFDKPVHPENAVKESFVSMRLSNNAWCRRVTNRLHGFSCGHLYEVK